MTSVRIIAAVVDTRQLLMYKADGNTIIIPQGDPRIRPLVDKVIPALKQYGFIELTQEEINQAPTFEVNHDHYAEAEKKMGGLVRFFRVAKSKLKEMVEKVTGVEPVEPTALVGSLPVAAPELPVVEAKLEEENAPLTKSMDAVNEIMANAAPAHSPEFAAGAQDESTTVVAVMEDGTVIPGMENLDLQLRHTAEKLGNPVGIMHFFERLATVKRGHSVADLLKFMEKGELPIADDGTILVYKRLRSTEEEGVFVDCYSGKVRQRVGSHVFMHENLVDSNRSQECSNGLHVARRDYLASFSGDICVLAKLAPEDVIAVPHRDARKLRAKGYFIIDVLSKTDHANVTSNRKLTDTNLLGNAVAGNHTQILETVEITSSFGGGLVITPVDERGIEIVRDSTLDAKPLKTDEDRIEENSTVDARTLAIDTGKVGGDKTAEVEMVGNTVVSIKTTEPVGAKYTAKTAVVPSKLTQLLTNFHKTTVPEAKLAAAKELVAYKKSMKKSWTALGISAATSEDVMARVNSVVKVSEELFKAPPGGMAVAVNKALPLVEATPPPAATATEEKPVSTMKMSAAEKAQHLWELYQKNPDVMNARALVTFKQKAKKSWTVLGLTDAIGKRMTDRIK